MKSYTLHVRADAPPGDSAPLNDAVLVKDGFAWGAFFFSFLWFFVHRLWIAGLIVLVAEVALALALRLLGVGGGAGFFAEFLLALLVGLEANSLRRWTLARRGRPAVDAVASKNLDEAEMKALARWLKGNVAETAPGPGLPPAKSAYWRPETIVGLFPEAERGR